MIRDLRDTLLSIGGATAMVALAGLALDSNVVLNIGLKASGIVLLTYSAVALGIAGANIVTVIGTVAKAVRK